MSSDEEENMNDNQENGYDSAEYSASVSDVDADEESPEVASGNGTYNNLPTAHKYLGKMEEVSGYTLYDDGQILTSMPALFTNTLVFPGFVLPLTMKFSESERVSAERIASGYTFVLITCNAERNKRFKYGIILEVFEANIKGHSLNFKAKGRQRCSVIYGDEVVLMWGRFQKVSVKILGEPEFRSVLDSTQMLALKKTRSIFTNNYDDFKTNYKYRRYHLSQYPFPSWIYDHNEICFYVNHILIYLFKYYVTDHIPMDPVTLSYWFAQNFQLNHDERLQLLSCNSAIERLKLSLKFLKMQRIMQCKNCRVDVADQKDVFSISKYGTQSNYVNPGGNVYEVITLHVAKNFNLQGLSSRQYSWFPGYDWTIMQCSNCSYHLGWKFTSSQLEPSWFYALVNANVSMFIVGNENVETNDDTNSIFLN